MILSDRDILKRLKKGDLKIEPFARKDLQPSTVDFHMGSSIRVFENWHLGFIDVAKKEVVSHVLKLGNKGYFIIHPGEFILGSTLEKVTIPSDLAGKLEGKSSLGRLGLIVHATAGFVDPGFSGQLTLEMSNLSRLPIKLYAGMRIAQFAIIQMSSPAMRPYGSKGLKSKYKGQRGPSVSKIHEDFSK